MHDTIRMAIAALCAGVALMAAAAAAIGVFARGDGSFVPVTSAIGEVYEMATNGVYANNARQVVAEGVGWDVFTLAVAAPALLIAAAFVARGSFRGSLVSAGMLGYFAYMYLEYAVTWSFGPLFLLFILILASSVIGLVGVTPVIADAGIRDRFSDRFPRRSWAALSIGMGALLTIMWIGRIAAGLTAEVPTLEGETTMTVQALDLGLVVPVSVLIGVLALRRLPIGLVAAAAMAVMFVAMSAAIAAMMLSAWAVTGTLALPPLIIFSLACLGGLLIGTRMYASVRNVPVMSRVAAHGAVRLTEG